MSYSEYEIINLALTKIGVKRITSADWTTPVTQQALDATAVWQYVRDEVLEAKDWRFAKHKLQLDQRYETPLYEYDYAYALPHDFLRLASPRNDDIPFFPDDPMFVQYTGLYRTVINREMITKLYPHRIEVLPFPTGVEKVANGTFTGAATGWTLGTTWAYGTNNVVKTAHTAITTLSQAYGTMTSAPVVGEKYSLEFTLSAIASGSLIPSVGGVTLEPVTRADTWTRYFMATSATAGVTFTPSNIAMTCTIDDVKLFLVEDKRCLLTDFDSDDYDLFITYIARVTDVTKYPPSFIKAVSWRLAQELCITRTESQTKFQFCENEYRKSLVEADAYNSSLDAVDGETGNNDWADAGR